MDKVVQMNTIYLPFHVIFLLGKSEETAHWVRTRRQNKYKWDSAGCIFIQCAELNWRAFNKLGSKVVCNKIND